MALRTVTIVGGGNGGRAAAVEFALAGHRVTLYENPEFAGGMKAIADTLAITATGVISGTARLNRVSFDIGEAVSGAEVIIVIVPTMYHLTYAHLLAPVLEDGQNVVLMPGSLGSLEFAEALRRQGVNKNITISDFAALPYATRITGPTSVKIFGRRAVLSMGVFPAVNSERVMAVMNDLYPGIQTMRDVFEAGLTNPNPTLHCLGVLLNAGRIEYSHGEFYYYEEGMTPGVCRAIEAIDQERINVGKALGLDILCLKDTYPVVKYGPTGDNFWQVIRGVRPLMGVKGPSELDNRYLTEDVPIGLVCYSQLGRQLGVDVKLMASVIHIAGAALGRNFYENGRTLERCGIAGMDAAAMIAYAKTGER